MRDLHDGIGGVLRTSSTVLSIEHLSQHFDCQHIRRNLHCNTKKLRQSRKVRIRRVVAGGGTHMRLSATACRPLDPQPQT